MFNINKIVVNLYSVTQDSKKRSLSEITIFIGNLLDHFNTSLYAFMAPFLAPIFFPNQEPVMQLILSYSVLATSIVTRPLGAIIFGVIACKRGPMFGLSYSLVGVAIATILLGCIPAHNTIGVFAPISLIIIRMLSGIFASGESSIAKLYVVENKESSKAFKFSCFYESSVMLGIIGAAGVATLVYNHYSTIGWRISFVFGGILGLLSSFLRYYACDKPILKKDHQKEHYKITSLLWKNKKNILKIAVVTGFSHATYSLIFIFLNSFVPLVSTSISLGEMLNINNYLLIFDLLVICLCANTILKHSINYDAVMLFSSLTLAVSMLPMFRLLDNSNIFIVTFIKLWMVFWAVIFVCPLNMWCEKLSTNLPEKYFVVGIGNSIGAALIGKTLSAVCFWLWYKTGSLYMPAFYITILMFLASGIIFTTGLSSFNKVKKQYKYLINNVASEK